MCITINDEFHGLDLPMNENEQSIGLNRTMRYIAKKQFFAYLVCCNALPKI